MNIIIRPAVKEDCPAMMQLVHELAAFERAPGEVAVSLPHFIESGFGHNPVWWGFVATHNDTIVAMAIYYIRYSTWKGQRMYLEDIIVTEAWRGKGIGRRLFEKLVQEAKDKQFSGMVWQALDWNEPALNFYKGFDAAFDAGWINCSLDF